MKWTITFLALSALAVVQGAAAQDREGQWETRLGLVFQNSADADFEGGTTADFESGTGFKFGLAYHYNDKLEIGVNLGIDQQDYEADIAGDSTGVVYPVEGELEYTNLMVDLTYNFLDGPFTPFVVGGIGWSWVDTNILTEPPVTGCWWDPWWGYVCDTFYDTRTIDGFAYQLGAGLRWDINDTFAVHGSYRKTWIEFDNARSAPDFDGFQLSLGWKF